MLNKKITGMLVLLACTIIIPRLHADDPVRHHLRYFRLQVSIRQLMPHRRIASNGVGSPALLPAPRHE